MKLGGGDIELGKQLPLEAGERKPKLHLLEHGGVDEPEQLAVAPLIVRTERFIREAGQHGHFAIVLFMEGKVGLVSFP